MKVKEYTVIYETFLNLFILRVGKALADGWELHGPMIYDNQSGNCVYMREMVKYSKHIS